MECPMCGVEAEKGQIFYWIEAGGEPKALCQHCKQRIWKVVNEAIEGWPEKIMVPQVQNMLEPTEFFGAAKADAGG